MGGLFGGGGGATNATQQTKAAGIRVQTSVYGLPIPLVYGRQRVAINLVWYGDFKAIAQEESGGKGGGESAGGGSYIYRASIQLAICEGPIEAILQVWESKGRRLIGNTSFTAHLGTYPQDPWSYLVTAHPDEAMPYPGVAHCDAQNYRLGESDALPNFNFELDGLAENVAGSNDCDPADVIYDLLTDARHGAGFPSARFAFPTVYSNYCRAAGLLIAAAYTDQNEASSILADIVELTNSEFYCSEGQLKICPYGDESISGNGGTYTAPSAPVAALGVDDFIDRDGDDPIRITRSRPADAYNEVKLEYTNRLNDYNPEPATVQDHESIERYGYRPEDQKDAKIFCSGDAAHMAAGLRLNRQKILNTYEFTLGWKWIVLDPMDIVSLTEPGMGLSAQWVRIKEIAEDDNGELTVTAEEYIQGTGTARVYPYENPMGYAPSRWNDPGNVTEPLIFEPPAALSEERELWVCVAGGTDWGGCDVHVSTDGSRYKKIGTIEGKSRYGTLRSAFASGSDPDTTHDLEVDLGISEGELDGGTQDDADLHNTLCYVDGEFVAYQSASVVSNYQYDLGTYIRRGLYGSTIAAHAQGDWFARIDELIGRIPYPKNLNSQMIWVKFCSFNLWKKERQDIADVTAYTFTPSGDSEPWHQADLPTVPDVANVRLQKGAGTSFTGTDLYVIWDDVRDDFPRAFFKDYKVEVIDTDGTTVLRTNYVKTELYKYRLTQNEEDFGTPSREIRVRVNCRAADGRVSSGGAVVTFSNPAPTMAGFSPTLSLAGLKATANWAAWADESDILQFKLYFGTTNPPTTLVASVSGRTNSKTLPTKLVKNQTYYFKIVPVDAFGEGTPSNVISSTGEVISADDVDETTLRRWAAESGATVNHVYYQASAPSSGMVTGDLWFDTDDENHLYRYGGSAWVSSRDQLVVNMGTDTKITRAEKPRLKQEWDAIVVEGNASTGTLVLQANALSVSHETFDAAYSALNTYLNTTLAVFADMAATTTVVRATWDTKWKDYFNARTDLVNALAAKAATTSTWAGVSGSGKPENNATVGAAWGSNLSGRPSNLAALSGSEGIQNTLVTVDTDGAIQGIGTGYGTKVSNDKITSANLAGTGKVWATLPESGATVGARVGVNLKTSSGADTSGDAILGTITAKDLYNLSALSETELFCIHYESSGPSILVGGTGEIFRSTNGGASWSSVASGLDAKVLCIVKIGSTLYAGTDNGSSDAHIYSSSNNGASWSSLCTAPSGVTAINDIINGVNGYYLFCCNTASNGKIYSSTNMTSWTQRYSSAENSLRKFASNGTTVLCCGGEADGTVVRSSTDTSWASVDTISDAYGSDPVIAEFCIAYTDPRTGTANYFTCTSGGSGLIKSSPLGASSTWTTEFTSGSHEFVCFFVHDGDLYAVAKSSGSGLVLKRESLLATPVWRAVSNRWASQTLYSASLAIRRAAYDSGNECQVFVPFGSSGIYKTAVWKLSNLSTLAY
jgi:hypothetical protein